LYNNKSIYPKIKDNLTRLQLGNGYFMEDNNKKDCGLSKVPNIRYKLPLRLGNEGNITIFV